MDHENSATTSFRSSRSPSPSVAIKESPPTPTETTEAIHFVPRRAMASFDNLVALANHQERLREARKMVWRDRGEPVIELNTLLGCLAHAARGGLRSGALAASLRSSVNLVLVLLRIHKYPRDIRVSIVRSAVFGLDTWRFAAMLGTFTSLYKLILNAVPILIPAAKPAPFSLPKRLENPFVEENDGEGGPTAENPSTTLHVPVPTSKRRARLSLSASAQLSLIRKRAKRWHAALAGAVAGGCAILWEKRARRGVIAQQLFVRGLQGSYNAFTAKRSIRIPHGEVLVFSLACGQIMYAFLLRQETLPRSYSAWICEAGKIPPECVRVNAGLIRSGTCDAADIDSLLVRSDITPSHSSFLQAFRSRILSLPLSADTIPSPTPTVDARTYFPRYAPCASVHPALSACSSVPLDRFFSVFRWMLPIYGALHFVPAVLFKRSAFGRDPGTVLIRAGCGTLRSSAFLGSFVVIYQTLFCYKHNLHRYLTLLRASASTKPTLMGNILIYLPQWFINLLVSKGSFWFLGYLAGLSILVEEKRRRGELAMYVLPKGLESAWVMARGEGWVFRTGNLGEMWLTALGMAMVMSTYQNDPQHLSGFVRRIMYQFIGPN